MEYNNMEVKKDMQINSKNPYSLPLVVHTKTQYFLECLLWPKQWVYRVRVCIVKPGEVYCHVSDQCVNLDAKHEF